MGGGSSKEEVKEGVIDNSSGFHLIEIHSNTAKLGIATLIGFIFIIFIIYYCWRKFCHRTAATTSDRFRARCSSVRRRFSTAHPPRDVPRELYYPEMYQLPHYPGLHDTRPSAPAQSVARPAVTAGPITTHATLATPLNTGQTNKSYTPSSYFGETDEQV
jgi:hypothetical protein